MANTNAAVLGVDEYFRWGCNIVFCTMVPVSGYGIIQPLNSDFNNSILQKRPIVSKTLKQHLEVARHDYLAPYHQLMLHRFLIQDLAESKNIAHGLRGLKGCIQITDGRLKKSEVVRQLREKSKHVQNCMRKIGEFEGKARDGGDEAFQECIVQPCRSLLGMQYDDPREVGDIDEETQYMIHNMAYLHRNSQYDEILRLSDQLIESKGLLYASRLLLLIRRLEKRPFTDPEFDSDLEGLWTKAWGEPYVEAFASIWSE